MNINPKRQRGSGSFGRPLMSTQNCCHGNWPITRREALSRGALGMGWLAATALLAEEGFGVGPALGGNAQPQVLAPRSAHFAGTARRVVLLFQHGGPSQIDLFDPKPALADHEGK